MLIFDFYNVVTIIFSISTFLELNFSIVVRLYAVLGVLECFWNTLIQIPLVSVFHFSFKVFQCMKKSEFAHKMGYRSSTRPQM